jgi:tRNA modification GTPase
MGPSADTICAVATPTGRGGVSIIRTSGQKSPEVAQAIVGFSPRARHAHYGPFHAGNGDVIDTGITLYFPGPDSFTGEDVVEFHAHGGPFIVDLLLKELLGMGLRLAKPGEFSERAFLNDKIDLAQAEAIADLIDSQSTEAARFAVRSLQGEFSRLVNEMVAAIIELRTYVEAAIDFPDEEVDFLEEGDVASRLDDIRTRLDSVLAQARQGSIMKEGLSVVIAGEPNAGKSSLLNRLAGQSRAIVTEIAGTTRDTLREHISIDGMPLHIIDTAGLRDSNDVVEQEGIRRAWQEIQDADLVLLVIDSTRPWNRHESPLWKDLAPVLASGKSVFEVFNKTDLSGFNLPVVRDGDESITSLCLSARTGEGIDELKLALKAFAGLNTSEEGGFIARRRHLDALARSRDSLNAAREQLVTLKAGELVAEDLRKAHQALESITGSYSADDLLGEIFSSFCIGK